jgi:lambda family phage tail tape measure protein
MADIDRMIVQVKTEGTQQATNDLNDLNSTLQQVDQTQKNLALTMRGTQNEFRTTSRLSASFTQSLFGLVSGATTARGALANILNSAARSVFKGSSRSDGGSLLGNIFSGLFNAKGNVFDAGRLVPFAKGGIVSSPSMFPLSGGQTGIMGEAGAEAIMPLRRMANGRLGVEAGTTSKNGRSSGTTVYLDARGADVGAVTRIEQAMQMLNASVERRAIDAVSDRFDRDPSFIRSR